MNLHFRLSSPDNIIPLSLFLSLSLFCFSLKRISLKGFFSVHVLYERTSCLCLKCLVLASVITLIRVLLSLKAKTLQFIYFCLKRIIDCCRSSHPHLRESVYLNLTNVHLFKNFKYKWRDRLVTDFCMFSPYLWKNIKCVNNSFYQ